MARKNPSVVLVGRPNVGKSTLFNKITGHRRAIVAPVAGTTRDSLARPASWGGVSFELFDTGGLYGASEDPLHELVVVQGKKALVGRNQTLPAVDDEHEEIGVSDGPLALVDYQIVERIFARSIQPTCIEQLEAAALPNDGPRQRVAGGAGNRRDNRAAAAGHPIEKRGFANVRTSDEHDRRGFTGHL